MERKKRKSIVGYAFNTLQEKIGDNPVESLQEKLGDHPIETLREKVGDHPIEALQEKLGDHPIETLQERVGDRAEQAIGNLIEKTPLEVPELQVVPGPGLSQRQAGQAGQVIQGLSQGQTGQAGQAGQGLSQGQIEPEPYQWYRV